MQFGEMHQKLKADQPHPRDYPYTPTDYRHTDKHLRLVMTLIALCCTRQSRAPSRESTDKQTDGQTDGRYQVHYLPALLPKILTASIAVHRNDHLAPACRYCPFPMQLQVICTCKLPGNMIVQLKTAVCPTAVVSIYIYSAYDYNCALPCHMHKV